MYPNIKVPLRVPLRVLWGLGFKGPCTQKIFTLGPRYLYRDYFKAKVHSIWVHGPVGEVIKASDRV